MKLVIPKYIYENIDTGTNEICANLIPLKNKLIFNEYSKTIGENITYSGTKQRGSCQLKYYSSVIFHTHPKIFYATPSIEDILKVFKSDIINTSVILTYWGVFQIIKYGNFNPIHFKLGNYIKKFLDKINKISKNPNLETKNISWGNLSENEKNEILSYIVAINAALNGRGKILLNHKHIIIIQK